ncbi:transposase family protein [Streptomyces sp. LARHCF249]
MRRGILIPDRARVVGHHQLVFVDRRLATLVRFRHGATHDVRACGFGVARSTIKGAIGEVGPLSEPAGGPGSSTAPNSGPQVRRRVRPQLLLGGVGRGLPRGGRGQGMSARHNDPDARGHLPGQRERVSRSIREPVVSTARSAASAIRAATGAALRRPVRPASACPFCAGPRGWGHACPPGHLSA